MTILLTFLPGLLICAPALLEWARRREPADVAADDRPCSWRLVLYATIPIIALVVWPGAATRYAMPALLAVAALAGLSFDRLVVRWLTVARLDVSILAGLIAYQIAWGWIRRAASFPNVRQDAYRAQTSKRRRVPSRTRYSRRCGWTIQCSPISTGRRGILTGSNWWHCRRRPICWPGRKQLT